MKRWMYLCYNKCEGFFGLLSLLEVLNDVQIKH